MLKKLILISLLINMAHGKGIIKENLTTLLSSKYQAPARMVQSSHDVTMLRWDSFMESTSYNDYINSKNVLDIELVYEFNKTSYDLWNKVIACADFDFEKAREMYRQADFRNSKLKNKPLKKYCKESLKDELSSLRHNISNFLESSKILIFPDSEGKSFKQIPRYHPLMNQILREYLLKADIYCSDNNGPFLIAIDERREESRKYYQVLHADNGMKNALFLLSVTAKDSEPLFSSLKLTMGTTYRGILEDIYRDKNLGGQTVAERNRDLNERIQEISRKLLEDPSNVKIIIALKKIMNEADHGKDVDTSYGVLWTMKRLKTEELDPAMPVKELLQDSAILNPYNCEKLHQEMQEINVRY